MNWLILVLIFLVMVALCVAAETAYQRINRARTRSTYLRQEAETQAVVATAEQQVRNLQHLGRHLMWEEVRRHKGFDAG